MVKKIIEKLTLKNFTIRKQIIILIASVSIIMYLMLVYLFANFQVIINKKTNYNFEQSKVLIKANINTILDTNKNLAESDSKFLELSHYISTLNINKEIKKIYENSLNSIVSQRKELTGIAIVGDDGTIVMDDFMKRHSNILEKIINQTDDMTSDKIHNSNIFNDIEEGQYYYSIYPAYTNGSIVAHIVSVYSMESVFKYLDDAASSNILMLRQNGKIIYSTDKTIGENYEINKDKDKVLINNIKYINFSDKLFDNIELVMLVPKAILKEDIYGMYPVVTIIFFFSILQLAIVGYIILNSVTKPVNNIIDQLDYVDIMEDNTKIETDTHNEVGIIAKHINEMITETQNSNKKLREAQKNLYESEISAKEAELSSLYSQINPHFLYNTLECIRSIALTYEANEIEEIAVAMSRVFRYSIKSPNIVRIEDELNAVKAYITIMNIRFPNYYQFEFEITPEVKECNCLKMTLQPIVENSFKHGFTGKRKKGKLSINMKIQDNDIITKITDNGVGIEKDKLAKINMLLKNEDVDTNEHIGIYNINKRIKLEWGERFGLSIESEIDSYTSVIIKTPW